MRYDASRNISLVGPVDPERRLFGPWPRCLAAGIGLAVLIATGYAVAAQPPASPITSEWDYLRHKYYGEVNDAAIGLVDEKFMSLDAPDSTPDPTATPLSLHFSDDPKRRIKRVRVFIDNNPAPLVATFTLPGQIPVTGIDMRVRVDRFTTIRAVAELADGNLEMRSHWVQASGGCSAPSSPSSGGKIGDIRIYPSDGGKALRVSIRHPNNSGFQLDPVSGDPIPAHYISQITVTAGGKELLDAQTGISISQNPTLRIVSDKPLPMPFHVDAVDSVTHEHYTATVNAKSDQDLAANGNAPGQ